MKASLAKSVLAHLLSLVCFLAFLPARTSAWGRDGHRIVARIAARHLSLKTRSAITDLLQADENDVGNCKSLPTFEDKLACISTFADAVRNAEKFPQFASATPLHFVNIPIYAPKTLRHYDAQLYCKKGCVVSGVRNYTQVLKTSTNQAERAVALKFIVHFIGDLHQPLHTAVDRDADFKNPENKTGGHVKLKGDGSSDLGGNLKFVTWFDDSTSPFGCAKLHSVWDDSIIEKRGLTDAAYTDVLDTLSAAKVAEVQTGNVIRWVNEALGFAVSNAYGTLPQRNQAKKVCEVSKVENGQKKTECAPFRPEVCHAFEVHYQYELGDSYDQENRPIVESQLQRAGLRLARYLNNIFDPAG
jgi:hypothetical protein